MAKMVKFEVEMDGNKYEVEAPENSTQAQLETAFSDYLEAERGTIGNAMRAGEFASREVVDVGADVLGAIPELVSFGLRSAGAPAPEAGYYPDAIKSGVSSLGKIMSGSLNTLMPNVMSGPMTDTDKLAQNVSRGTANAASVFLPAAALAKVAKAGTTTANVLTELSKQKALQAAAGITGEVVQGATDSPTAGFVASMAVPFVALVPSAAKNATIVALRRAGLKEDAPTTDILKRIKSTAYDAVDNIQGEVKPSALQRFKNDLEPAMESVGYDKYISEGPSQVLKSITKMLENGDSLDLRKIEQIRKRIGITIENSSLKRGDLAIAMKMRDQFDDWFEALAGKDITVNGKEIVGDVVDNAAANALKTARAANVKFRKSEAIDQIIADAELSPSGLENGLRIGFRSLLKNSKRIKGFSEDERKMMQEIVTGNAITNLTRLVGGFGFRLGGGSPNIVGGSIGYGAGASATDPIRGAGLPLIGSASKILTDKLGRNSADYLRAMAATGGKDIAPRSRVSPRDGLLGAVGLQNISQ